MEKKIGIVTWFNYANPGTAFQAYALQQYINSIPHCKAELLNMMNRLLSMICAPILRIYAKSYGYFSLPVFACLAIKAYRFCSFQRKYIDKYPYKPLPRNLTEKDCNKINNRYSCVILGSDQLWNFGLDASFDYSKTIERMFLSFVSGPQKGAYAPSLGANNWPDKYKDKIKDLLSDFSFVGVREKQAVSIVQPLAKIPVHWSLDPTFLLDKADWEKVAKRPKHDGDYIFEYCIIKSPELRAATEKLAALTGLPVIEYHMDLRKHVPSAKRMPHPNPETWLGYLMNAKYVVTDSFHGCAFAVNTNRYFYAIVTSFGSRIYSMLELFGLQSRVLTKADGVNPSDLIEWNSVNLILEEQRNENREWLKSSLMKNN